jgi:heme A synthase
VLRALDDPGILVSDAFPAAEAPRQRRRRFMELGFGVLVVVVCAQGTLGLVQYALGVPELLVSLHVLGAMLVITATALLWCGARDRGPRPQFDEPVPPRTDHTEGLQVA